MQTDSYRARGRQFHLVNCWAGRRALVALVLLAVASPILVGCSGFGGEVRITPEVDRLVNHNFPLAVDIVVVYDTDLYGELGRLTAEEWFASRDQYRLDNEPRTLKIVSREWVPCQGCAQPKTELIEHRTGALGIIVFSNYFNPGTHRIVVEPPRSFTLKLGETEATSEPIDPRR